MSLGQQQQAFSRDVLLLFTFLHVRGFQVRIGEAYRTKEQQALHVKAGRSQTFNSMHLKKCAIDLHIFKNSIWLQNKEELQEIGDFWESLSPQNRWGGNWETFTDCPHFERKV